VVSFTESVKLTAEAGFEVRATVKVAVPPASVVVSPVLGVMITPAMSVS